MKLKNAIGGLILGIFIMYNNCEATENPVKPADNPGVRKVKDVMIYEDAQYYSSFPSIVKGKNGEFLVAFRRAPDRKNI